MSKFVVFGFIFLHFQLTATHPIVFENGLNSCSHNISLTQQSALIFTSKLQKVENTDVVIFFTLCGYLPPQTNCGANVAACIKEKNSDYSYVLGTKLIPRISDQGGIENILFTSDGAEFCRTKKTQKYKFSVEFDCKKGVEEIRLKKKNECEYKIYMTDPKCLLSCTTKIDEQLFDLKGLKGYYFVESKNINFSISLCGEKRKCFKNQNSDVSICAKYNGSIVPLSTPQKERILYNRQKNEIFYRGSYKGENGTKKFELLLKCSWEDDVTPKITHKEVQIQGREYKFVMETSYGCVKLPPTCEKFDGPLFYNITNLSNINGYRVLNVPMGDIYLNLCGPLTFKSESGNSCSKSFSQVCELANGIYVNRGSIMSRFDVDDDAIKVTYSNGMKCKEDPSKQYSTHIDLFCSKTNDGPTFVMANHCDLFINWKTPLACPQYDQKSCAYEQKQHNECSVTYQGRFYDFSYLKPFSRKHEVIDPKNSSIKYFLNICNPVIDSEAPCMKNSAVILKDMNEKNVKYRTKSLGQMSSINIKNGEIVIEAMGGTYCGAEGDYRSEIHLVCGTENEMPRLVNRTECTFKFQWKTSSTCLEDTRNSSNQCLLKDPSSGVSLDFARSRKKSLEIDIDHVQYMFNICHDNYTECSPNGRCENIPVTKSLSSNGSSNVLEIFLPKTCDAENVINKVRFELVCSEFVNNEYFTRQDKIMDNCTVKLLFYTDIVCSRKGYQVAAKEDNKYHVLDENAVSNQVSDNCSVSSPATGHKIYLSSLTLNIPTVTCPTTLFYDHNNTVVLIYPSTRSCDKSNKGDPYQYKTVLQCSSRESREVKKMDCLELHQITGPDFCKMFPSIKMDKPKKNYTLEIVFGVLGIIVLCLCFSIYVRCKWKRSLRRSPYLTIYEKDGDI